MTKMPRLQELKWDFRDNFKETTLDLAGNKAYYVYDASGNRVRKIVKKGSIIEDRIYIGNYEVYRKITSGTLNIERETLNIMDDKQKIAQIDSEAPFGGLGAVIRDQLSDHLGSASVELDQNADIISYEEYYPFGTTSYRSGRTETEVSQKRYKYVMKELDNETGLYYCGMRYYAAWIARFVSVDPLQHKYPELTPFQYASNNPITMIDIDGLEGSPVNPEQSVAMGEHILKPILKKIYEAVFKEESVKSDKLVEKHSKAINKKTEKITIQSQIYLGINEEHPKFNFEIPYSGAYADFSEKDIEKIVKLYENYQGNQPEQYTKHDAGRCIDILNYVLSDYYDYSRETFLDKKRFSQDFNPELFERVDYTGIVLYDLDYVANFTEIETKKGESVQEALLGLLNDKISAQYFFIISAGSGTHTTAMILDNTDINNPSFTFLDTYNIYENISEEETQNKYIGFEGEGQVTRIYQLKPKK